MKTFLPLFILFTTPVFSQLKIDTLTNETIVRLAKNNLSENVIAQKINASFCSFDISVNELIRLKESSVSDNVINLMIRTQARTDAATLDQAANNSNDKDHSFTESGIYFLKDGRYTNLDPTLVSATRLTGAFTVKYKSQIEGAEANYRINSNRPDFYFNFETMKKSLNDANANTTNQSKENYLDQLISKVGYGYNNSNYQAISPNDFKLVRLDKNRNKREFVTGKTKPFQGIDMSIDDKYIVNFKYERISSNTYKIRFDKDLEPGEYCFIYLGNGNNAANARVVGQNNLKVFDFSIGE